MEMWNCLQVLWGLPGIRKFNRNPLDFEDVMIHCDDVDTQGFHFFPLDFNSSVNHICELGAGSSSRETGQCLGEEGLFESWMLDLGGPV